MKGLPTVVMEAMACETYVIVGEVKKLWGVLEN